MYKEETSYNRKKTHLFHFIYILPISVSGDPQWLSQSNQTVPIKWAHHQPTPEFGGKSRFFRNMKSLGLHQFV